MKDHQIIIASNDVIRVTAYGELQEFIVLWVPRGRDLSIDVDPFGGSRERSEKALDIFLLYVPPKSRSGENFVELSDDGKGKQHLPLPYRKSYSTLGL
jgi:hypothetical protein